MKRVAIKFFIIFIATMSVVFFSLVFFQKNQMDKQKQFMMPMMPPMATESFMEEPPFPPPINPMDMKQKEPPFYIPLLLLFGLSSLFVFILLKYIDKEFITPLNIIENKLKEIKKGSLEVDFKTTSSNNTVQDTFNTLNEMVQGLKEREKLQDNFIQNLTHDLRAPILAQERAISILMKEFNNHELLAGMKENNETYLEMINLIIEAYRDKEVKIDKILFNFVKMTNNIIDALRAILAEKHINIEQNIPNNFNIYADYISLNRIIMNLISNAIDNIPDGKTIKITATHEKDYSTIIIEDNGQGIKAEYLNKIFEKYTTGSSKKSVKGLGLSIVKELVVKNNGEINVESEENLFTKFIIKLPNKENV